MEAKKNIKDITELFNTPSENTIREVVTIVVKYGLRREMEISTSTNPNTGVKSFSIQNLGNMAFKSYETEGQFFNAVKRLLKKQ